MPEEGRRPPDGEFLIEMDHTHQDAGVIHVRRICLDSNHGLGT